MTSTATDQINGFSGSLALKQPVRLATLVDIVLEGLIAIDGIVPAEGDRVLVKAQATPSQNGIYIASTGVWSRAVDFDATGKVVKGTQVWVTDGTTQAGTLWIVSAANPVIVDTSALTWQAGNAYQQGAAMAAAIIAATSKPTPVAADRIGYVNSVDNSFVQMTWAQMMAALLPGAAASSFVRRNAGNTAYEHRSAAQVLSDIGGVAKTGDTMTGDLVIAKTQPNLVLLKAASGSNNLISGYTSSNPRWQIAIGDSTAEGGANAGSDISIYRFADNGALLDTPFQLVRATGAMNLNSGQLKFPATQNASSDANTLDDYEEGTWTPDVRFNSSATGVTYGGRSGTYTKIGRVVICNFNFTLTNNGTGVGKCDVYGLPFTPSAEYYAGCNYAANLASMGGIPFGNFHTSGYCGLRQMSTAGAATDLTDTHVANTAGVFFSGYYVA
jgi:hypothetical protein